MLTRRATLAATVALAATPHAARALSPMPGRPTEIAVVGAGVFGAWTAHHLARAGHEVLLIDSAGPANARASSGGESRMIRAAYGPDRLMAQMATASLAAWRALDTPVDQPLFHDTGVLFLFQGETPFAAHSLAAGAALGLPTRRFTRADLSTRVPALALDDIAFGLFEPTMGVLMARRAVQTLVARYRGAGGRYLAAQVAPPAQAAHGRLRQLETSDGPVRADHFIFAAGPWLPKLFPQVIANKIRPTRQEVFFFRPPPGDQRFAPPALPGWADWNDGKIWYGMPDLESRGFKIAHDPHGPAIDPDTGDRTPSPQALEAARAYMARRFPAMAGAPLNEARVCQYENSASGDFLIDRHPEWSNVIMVGAGSGHGFKHGPEVGRLAAALALDATARPHPRFAFAALGRSPVARG